VLGKVEDVRNAELNELADRADRLRRTADLGSLGLPRAAIDVIEQAAAFPRQATALVPQGQVKADASTLVMNIAQFRGRLDRAGATPAVRTPSPNEGVKKWREEPLRAPARGPDAATRPGNPPASGTQDGPIASYAYGLS